MDRIQQEGIIKKNNRWIKSYESIDIIRELYCRNQNKLNTENPKQK